MLPDLDFLLTELVALLNIPSPSGMTHLATAYLVARLESLGVQPHCLPKGDVLWTLPGAVDGPVKTLTAHVDTLGAVVAEVKANGRLLLSAIGSYDWSTVEGAEVVLHTEDGVTYSGTVVTTQQSCHIHTDLAEFKRTREVMEVRLDARTKSEADTRALGVCEGDFITFVSGAHVTAAGFVKGRHLDNKAGVAVLLALTAALRDRPLPGTLHFFVSVYEEVGHGGAAGLPADTEELLCIDMAPVGSGQRSDEYSVTLCVKDSAGPFDRTLNRALRSLAGRLELDLKVDTYLNYQSDVAAAWRAGASLRAALIGPGIDASHAFERTHQDALLATAELAHAYCLAATPISTGVAALASRP